MSYCVVCKKEIEGTIIRSPINKQTMHLECFNCLGCGRNFHKYNMMNQIYDFNGKPWCRDCHLSEFSERCAECSKPIKEPDYVQAFGASFHDECFISKKRKLKCRSCNKGFEDDEDPIDLLDAYYHERCFNCTQCGTRFSENNQPGESKGKFICRKCHDENLMDTEKCCQCKGNIMHKDDWCLVFKLKIHRKCLRCADCNKDLEEIQRFLKGGKIYCKDHK
eukprot:TRINITY_DN2350_c0_g1_i1.p1 TRINITY_DN2350_c0_g1~~TRINITY_DN2350_c0_g1_i1.p1  ORF type:complete len:221 (+),score=7.42 TRINITY_DN2350_c0_g1_i1:80-742(+)